MEGLKCQAYTCTHLYLDVSFEFWMLSVYVVEPLEQPFIMAVSCVLRAGWALT